MAGYSDTTWIDYLFVSTHRPKAKHSVFEKEMNLIQSLNVSLCRQVVTVCGSHDDRWQFTSSWSALFPFDDSLFFLLNKWCHSRLFITRSSDVKMWLQVSVDVVWILHVSHKCCLWIFTDVLDVNYRLNVLHTRRQPGCVCSAWTCACVRAAAS